MKKQSAILMAAAWKVTVAIQENKETFDTAYNSLCENCEDDIARMLTISDNRKTIAALVSGFIKEEPKALVSKVLATVDDANTAKQTVMN